MPAAANDSISSLSCFGSSFLLLHGSSDDIAGSLLQASRFRRLVQHLQCHANLSPEVSKALFRLKKQEIQVTPKVLYRVKKKEACKGDRRARKEKEKAGRVTGPVWFDWPEEQAAVEKRMLSVAQKEEDGTDDFLCFMDRAHPTKRVVGSDVDNAGMSASSRALSLQKRGMKAQRKRTVTKVGSGAGFAADGYGGGTSIYKKSVALMPASTQILEADGVARTPAVGSEDLYPWSGKQALEEWVPTFAEPLDKPDFIESTNRCTRNVSGHGPSETSDSHHQLISDPVLGSNNGLKSQSQQEHGVDMLDSGLNGGIALSQDHLNYDTKRNFLSADTDIILPESYIERTSPEGSSHIEWKSSMANNFDNIMNDNYDNFKCSNNSANTSNSCLPNIRSVIAADQHTSSLNLESSHGTHPPASKTLHNITKEALVGHIETFLDDGVEEVPKKREIWMKEVGLVRQRKDPFSKEAKDRILGVRRGDLSVLDEEEVSDDELDGVYFPFDGREALVEDKRIQRLAAKLDEINYWTSKIYFSQLMHSGKMKLTEDRVIRIIQILGEKGNWRRAMQVVRWVHKRQRYQFHASKFVMTTLMSILGKARRPVEALNVFNVMQEYFSSYPDMAAYHVIANILGQAGQLRELLHTIESLEVGPSKPVKFIEKIHWDPSLYPDTVVYNCVLTACIAIKEWAGVFWTWEQLERRRMKPNGATFGLTIEAMAKANMFDQVVRFYKRMERAGFPPNAQTYKSLVEAFGNEKMTDQAIELVKEMEASGIVGTASVYFSLACSFCLAGRLQEALIQVKKIQELPSRKPDVVTYTGLIQACHKVGRIQDAIFLFNHMQHTCAPNVRTCNEMIKIYAWNNMFQEAKKIYEGVKIGKLDTCILFDNASRLSCDYFTFELMLKAAVVSEHWTFFDAVYHDMTSQGYHICGRKNYWLLLKVARQAKLDVAEDMLWRLRKSGEVAPLRVYEASVLSNVQARRFQGALVVLNGMRIDGYEVKPVMQDLEEQVEKRTWDDFVQDVNVAQFLSFIN